MLLFILALNIHFNNTYTDYDNVFQEKDVPSVSEDLDKPEEQTNQGRKDDE